jgi:uncharacterized lipoprotein YddW (UPF0748 family)
MLRRAVPLLALALVFGHAPSRLRVPTAPPPVPREFRAAWATPIWDRGFKDWPSNPNMTSEEQRAELRTMLDNAAAARLNAVVMHVRLAGDALYPTAYAPWSVFLTGKSGVGPSPAYDPLAYAVDEAHARGLQLHAWFNPFRAMLPNFAGKAAPSHVTKKHPEWIRKYGSQTWIDPGDPAARKFVLETILDVVKRYDVDGIHLDDYFYPYRESRTVTKRVRGKRVRTRVDIQFPDDKTWKKYGKAEGFTDRDAWRRHNIDTFVQELYTAVKKIKPTMVVGISPFGIWRPGNPPGITGLDAFGEIYADSRKWLREGWLDYIAPQIYWEIGGTQDRFRVLDTWWRTQNPLGRFIWPGLYTSRVYGSGSDVWPMREIPEQIAELRDARIGSADPPGHIHFRLGAMFADNNRLALMLADQYREKAIVPAFPWLDPRVPAAPKVSYVISKEAAATFAVAPGDSVRVRWWLIQTRGRDGAWATTLRPAGEGRLGAAAFGTNDPDEIAVTALSESGVASAPTIVTP